MAFVAASDTSDVILSEHAEALPARHRHAVLRFRIATQRAVFDWHRLALRAQRDRKRVHAFGRLGGRHIDIAAHAVMDNDRHARVHAPVGSVVDATERHGVGAAGLDIPELNAASVRIGEDAVGTASHIRYVAVAQVVRGAGATHYHTYCDSRDNGDPCTFNIWFHLFFSVLFCLGGHSRGDPRRVVLVIRTAVEAIARGNLYCIHLIYAYMT